MEDYLNSDLTIRKRVSDLMKRMTVKEKIGQINQHLYGWKCYKKSDSNGFELTDYLKEHVEWGKGLGSLYGVLRADPWSKVDYETGIEAQDSYLVINKIQKYVIDHSRLGIPTLFSEECPHGHQGLGSISYPTNLGKGNSFNTDLMREMAQAEANELKIKGINLALVSTLDLAKDPRWGRTEECFGEDPLLSARFSESIVKGFQGSLIKDDEDYLNNKVPDERTVGVILKHFIAQGETLGGHNSGSVNIGNREFHQVYDKLAYSTRNAVGIMAAYNDIDGIPCHSNENLLTEFLRKQNGFKGMIMSDGTALDRLVDIYGTKEEAAYAALKAGIDLSLWDDTFMSIEKTLDKHPDVMSYLDRAVEKVLSIKFLLGLFDHPYVESSEQEYSETVKHSEAVNLEVAHESITLLKNKGNILPLNKNKKIAVIGPNGNSLYNMLGDYTAPQTEKAKKNTIYNSLKEKFLNVSFAKGCDIRDTAESLDMISEAVQLASKSDVIILTLGGSSTRNFDMKFLANGAVSSKGINMDSGENVDVASLTLGGAQEKLISEISRLNKPVITILVQGRPYDISRLIGKTDALLVSWYPGQMGSKAIADIIDGTYNPNGKLSVSYPVNSEQLPVYYYQRAIAKNDNYYDESGAPAYPFGFGKHYGNLSYKDLNVSRIDDYISVSIKLSNDSKFSVKESVLLFSSAKTIGVFGAIKRMVDFEKVYLDANSSMTVKFKEKLNELSYINASNEYTIPESVMISVGDLKQNVSLE